ncbi:MAG: hypothetical protein ACRDGG_10130 [Anaerolineae bacterium]
MSVISGTNVLVTIPVSRGPEGLSAENVHGQVFVVNSLSNTLSGISGTQVVATYPVGLNPSSSRITTCIWLGPGCVWHTETGFPAGHAEVERFIEWRQQLVNMGLFNLAEPFQIIACHAPIVVGAPHHGIRPNVAADRGTGPIAMALAARLDASAVVVSDLRRTVDVNKNPLRLSRAVRHHALRYQNELFKAGPPLVIEIHGHTSGQYAVEVSTGFDLDPAAPGDARFLEKLAALKQALPGALAGRIGLRPTVGVYPLDRDVKKTATDTFTFQKIRRARNLAGIECYGLHVELSAELRTSRQAQSAAFIDALADALAASIRAAFDPLPPSDAIIPTHTDRSNGATELLAPRTLSVTPAPERFAHANVIVVHPAELEALGALEGDVVIIRNSSEEMRSTIASSLTVRPGHAALPVRVRRQISLGERGRLIVGRPAPIRRRPPSAPGNGVVVVRESRQSRDRLVWLPPAEISRFGLQPNLQIRVQGQPDSPAMNSTTLQADPGLPPRAAALSRALMDHMRLTLGEVIALEASD